MRKHRERQSMESRLNKQAGFAFLSAIAIIFIASCATQGEIQAKTGDGVITPDLVLESSPLATGLGSEDVSQIDPLALSPEMIGFLDEHVDRDGTQYKKLAQLVYAVISEGRFKLVYDDSTRTAADTFHNRRGNCLSFTNLFVAMARNVGLKASYQEVEIPPDWSLVGKTLMLSEHVNVLVDLPNRQNRIVDFNLYDFDMVYEKNVISDQRALAHYYNNIGVEHMLADETLEAYANLRMSIRADRTFSPAWVNMGNLHRRERYKAYAEVAYLEALRYDSNNLMAMSNLANLYQEDNPELAEHYLLRVRKHRLNNPYYRYQLANTAFNEGDYQTAIENLKFAVRKRNDEDRFYFLMSLSYLMSGEKDKARRWMEKAEDVARKSATKKRYQHKLDLLKAMGND